MTNNTNYHVPLRYWPLWLVIQLVRIIIIIIPFRCLLWLGKAMGRLYYYFPSRAKAIAKINIAACFPDWTQEKRTKLLRENFESLGMSVFETLVAWWAPKRKIAKLVHIHGLEHVTDPRLQSRRVIALGGHFLPMEMAGRLFSLYFDFSVIFRAPPHPLLNALLHMARRTHYTQLQDRRNMYSLVKNLRKGIPLWYSPDIDPGKQNGVFAPFFNVPAYSLTATARLAKIADAKVIVIGYFRRDDGKGYDLTIYPPLEDFPGDDPVQDATRINQTIEDLVRQKPAQYLWQYRRFRTRPAGEQKWY